jgi:hypothetical protein
MDLENLFIYLLFGGIGVLLLGHLVMIVMGFRQSAGWGLAVLLLPPLGGLAFIFKHFKKAIPALLIMLVGACLIGAAYYPALSQKPQAKAPVVRTVNGATEVTVTGKPDFDYTTLSSADYPNLVTLQMANPNVTDQTLRHLKGLTTLKELDLNNTQITDDGLVLLIDLPALEFVRLCNTKVTDAGLQSFLAAKPGLSRLVISRKNPFDAAALDAWKKAKPGRRLMLDDMKPPVSTN